MQQKQILIEMRVRVGDVIAVRHRCFVKIDRVKTFEERIAERHDIEVHGLNDAPSNALLVALQIDHD